MVCRLLDCYVQGPGSLTLNSLPGLSIDERTLGRESKVGESPFCLLALCCVVLGKTLTDLWTSLSLHLHISRYISPTCSQGVMAGPGRTSCAWRTGLGPGPVLSPLHTLSHASLHSGRQLLLSPHNSPVRWLGGPKPSLPCSLPHRVAGRTGLGPAGLSVALALRRRPQGGGGVH